MGRCLDGGVDGRWEPYPPSIWIKDFNGLRGTTKEPVYDDDDDDDD